MKYHLVFLAKYQKVVISDKVDAVIKEICLKIEKRYDVKFLEIGTDKDHVHFLVQSEPESSISELVRMMKSIIAKEVFRLAPEVKKQLWGGGFWSDGFFAGTVGRHADEMVIQNYVKNQGTPDYKAVDKDYQLQIILKWYCIPRCSTSW